MEWITRIISYIFSFAAGYFFYKIECCFLTPKKGKLLFLLTWVLLSAAVTLVIFPRDPVNITVALVSLLLANGLLSEDMRYLLKTVFFTERMGDYVRRTKRQLCPL